MLPSLQIDTTTGYQLGPNSFVQLAALVVCGTHYEDPLAGLMGGEVISGYLIDGPSCFDRMMLTLVAHENDPPHVLLTCFVEESVNLPRGEQARLVDDPDFL